MLLFSPFFTFFLFLPTFIYLLCPFITFYPRPFATPGNVSPNHSPKSNESTQKRNEDKIELIFKSKRENVYTAGVSLDNRINYHPKNIKKSISQSKLISKFLYLFY